jgi:hypothetical protein
MQANTLRSDRRGRASPRTGPARSRLGRFGEGIYKLVCQLEAEEQDALLRRGGHGFLVRVDSDGLPEAALVFDPEHTECRRLLRYTGLHAERLA